MSQEVQLADLFAVHISPTFDFSNPIFHEALPLPCLLRLFLGTSLIEVPFCQRNSHFPFILHHTHHPSIQKKTKFWSFETIKLIFLNWVLSQKVFFYSHFQNKANIKLSFPWTPHGGKPRNGTDPDEEVSWEAWLFHWGKPICSFLKPCKLQFLMLGLSLTGVWGTNTYEVLDCKVNGPRQSSQDVCPVAKLEGCNSAQWGHFWIWNSRWIGTQKNLSTRFIKG